MSLLGDKAALLMRRSAMKIIPSLVRLNITPNQVTLGYFLLLMPPTVYLLSFGNYFFNLAAIFLFYLTRFGDHLDGELARARNMTSKLGAKLDETVGYLASVLVFVGIGFSMNEVYPVSLLIVACLIITKGLYKIQKSKLNFFLRSYLFWLTVCVPLGLLPLAFFIVLAVSCFRIIRDSIVVIRRRL